MSSGLGEMDIAVLGPGVKSATLFQHVMVGRVWGLSPVGVSVTADHGL